MGKKRLPVLPVTGFALLNQTQPLLVVAQFIPVFPQFIRAWHHLIAAYTP